MMWAPPPPVAVARPDTPDAVAVADSSYNPDEDDEVEDDDEEEYDDSQQDDQQQQQQQTQIQDDGTAAATTGGFIINNSSTITAVSSLSSLAHLREVSQEAICWQLSSAKPGNGVEQLRDNSIDTYWQSDGVTQPHWVQLHWHRRLPITHVAMYLDYQLDESYTPKSVRVETGMTSQDLTCGPITKLDLHEPAGWCILPVSQPTDPLMIMSTTTKGSSATPVSKVHILRISVLSMHQNGRDTHVRRLAVFAERNNNIDLLKQSSTTLLLQNSFMDVDDENVKDDDNDDKDNNTDDDDDWNFRIPTNSVLNGLQAFSTTIR